ncbi:MAG TPA: L-histidine N(alpha)-methyltransferase [Bryobacteraceae bacterium]|nr:L-histidine N(alpha)-methyltransferase [Bryobacteraceae bacterium]
MTYARALANEFAREVRAGLSGNGQKTLPCRYLYDDVGSALFDAITCLAEYGLTRADTRLLTKLSSELAARLPNEVLVAELGSGSGSKTRPILEQLARRQPVVYYPIDVSRAALDRCEKELSTLGKVVPLEGNYTEGLREVARERARGQSILALFLGSTIGNFEPEAAIRFLVDVRQSLRPGDRLLLGTDLVKPVEQLLLAYDDPAGVTAAFNLNLLGRINRELDADFDLRQFEHVARYIDEEQRIEMHLRSRIHQTVTIPAADLSVDFAPNETICTEASHKFRLEQIPELGRLAGFHLERQWIDCDWPFAENLLVAIE